jgi:hypothetical protein
MYSPLINRVVIEKFSMLFNNLENVSYGETKTTYNVTKDYNGHSVSVYGPKVPRHWLGYARKPAEERGVVSLSSVKLKIDNTIICNVSSANITFFSTFGMEDNRLTLSTLDIRIKFLELIRFKEVRPEGVLYMKMVMPEIFTIKD